MRRAALLALVCGTVACGGRGLGSGANDAGAAGASGAGGSVGTAGVGGAGAPVGDGGAGAAAGTAGAGVDGGRTDPGWTGLRRLTGVEYANTLRDLLGVDPRAFTNATPAEPDPLDGFDNEAARLGVSSERFEWYFGAAVTATTAAFSSDALRARLLICDPTPDPATKDAPCARRVLSTFGLRAWRRPLAADEVDDLASLVADARVSGDAPTEALQRAFVAMLASEAFLYRVELDPAPTTLAVHALTPYELATRLSYLLWSSTPDDTALALAEKDALSDEASLRAEVQRLLADPRADGFVRNFAGQWLGFRALEGPTLQRPSTLYWSPGLQKAAGEEARRFAEVVMREDRPLADLLTADVNFVDDYYLASIYGIPRSGQAGDPVRVDGNKDTREGILGLVATLALTSPAAATSPTKRGLWVSSRLLCQDVPPGPGFELPPPGTPRERAAALAGQPGCANCHTRMDPIGLGLEAYDQVGAFRAKYVGEAAPIDASGALPGGASFDGLIGLAEALARDPRFRPCATRWALTYALGRRLVDGDAAAIARVTAAAGAGGTLRALLAEIVVDDIFRLRRGEGS